MNDSNLKHSEKCSRDDFRCTFKPSSVPAQQEVKRSLSDRLQECHIDDMQAEISRLSFALEKLVVKFEAVVKAVDPYIALQAVRSGNPNLYQGPTCEPELGEAKKLLASLNGKGE